jgi:CRISPR/Cas system CMR subunit Cmr4 (Cas7 group RAMP superfamily)
MRLAPGEQLVRWSARTPANLGSSQGAATLDRPTQKDAVFGLPYLPDSALKGVAAGRFGDEGKEREALFGSADRPATASQASRYGEAGPVIFGNGELLAFPLPVAGGPPAWVFPALHLAKALRLEGEALDDRLLRLLRSIEDPEIPRVVAWPDLPRIGAALRLVPSRDPLTRAAAPALLALLARYAGSVLPAEAPRLVVSAANAGVLWRFAAERRALVEIETRTRTVAPGSLRFVELIPAGAVFLSWVSCLAGPGLELSALQLGAWEGAGLGWFEASAVEPPREAPLPSLPKDSKPDPSPSAYPRVLVEAHQAVQALAGLEPGLQRAIRSATRQFGSRAQFSGLEAALAFELAKARPAQARPSVEARAHRWLLSALLTSSPRPPAERGASEELRTWIASDPFSPGRLEGQRPDLLERWLWLARFCENLLEEDSE